MRYWKRIDIEGKTTTVESYSFDANITGAIEITQDEFDAFITSLPMPIITPARDLLKEIDTLKARVATLELK